MGIFLTSWGRVIFWGRNVFHAVGK